MSSPDILHSPGSNPKTPMNFPCLHPKSGLSPQFDRPQKEYLPSKALPRPARHFYSPDEGYISRHPRTFKYNPKETNRPDPFWEEDCSTLHKRNQRQPVGHSSSPRMSRPRTRDIRPARPKARTQAPETQPDPPEEEWPVTRSQLPITQPELG